MAYQFGAGLFSSPFCAIHRAWYHSAHEPLHPIMKVARFLFSFSFVALTGCSTAHFGDNAKADSETVLVTYHAKPGKETELLAVLSQAWQIYSAEHLVFAEPHTLVRDTEDGDKTRVVEVFTWVSHATPEHAPDAVKKVWEQEQSLCEPRSGHGGIEGGEVELITGK
jgi:hypothetical protein